MKDTQQPGGTQIRIIHGDITHQVVDAIVNAANSGLLGGGGVDGAIHQCGGPAILEACRTIRRLQYPDGLPPGEAVSTTAGHLAARRVIHTVGPVWAGGHGGEPEVLASAYRKSLEESRAHGLRSIAFPAISTGVYGYPQRPAARIAINTVLEFVSRSPDAFDEIRFVLFSKAAMEIYRELFLDSMAVGPPSSKDE